MNINTFSHRWLILTGVIFIAIYSSFYIVNHELFNSPDETANHFFINELARYNRLAVSTDFSGELGKMIVPRSIRVVNGAMVPGSFLGLIIIYGLLVSLLGEWFLYIIGGIIAGLGAWAYYLLIRDFWGVKNAFYSFFVLLALPAWWYYASLAFFPNVLLMTLILWSLVAALQFSKNRKLLWLLLSATLTAFALITRLAVFPWLAIIWVILAIMAVRKKGISFVSLFIWLAVIAVFLFGLSVIQHDLYGSNFATGYVLTEEIDTKAETLSGSLSNFSPVGWHPRLALKNFWNFYIRLFWFLSFPALLGLFVFLINIKKESIGRRIYLLIALLVGAWLVNYYGSWQLTDNINEAVVSLGGSYVRYWLPFYLFSIPLAVYGLIWLVSSIFKAPRPKYYATAFLLIVFFLVSFRLTYLDKNDSLLFVSQTLHENKLKKEAVLSLTERGAVIISYRQDKIFFPARAVMHTLNDASIFALLPELLKLRPVYFYSFLSDDDIASLIEEPLNEQGLELQFIAQIEDDRLYKIVKNSQR